MLKLKYFGYIGQIKGLELISSLFLNLFKCIYLNILNDVCGSHYFIWTALI